MRGTVYVSFHRDWYLDHRRPGWADAERFGHVRAVRTPDGVLVNVHMDHAAHICDVLALQHYPRSRRACVPCRVRCATAH